MDFVISKVLMSACALLVVGVLGGCMDPASIADPGHELENFVLALCDLVDRASLSHSECRLVWPVPYLSDGRGVTVVVDMGTVAAEADGERRFGQPVAGVHTWRNTGAAMNMTGLMLLDSKADALISRSGESITIETDLLLLDNQPTYVAFARMMP